MWPTSCTVTVVVVVDRKAEVEDVPVSLENHPFGGRTFWEGKYSKKGSKVPGLQTLLTFLNKGQTLVIVPSNHADTSSYSF